MSSASCSPALNLHARFPPTEVTPIHHARIMFNRLEPPGQRGQGVHRREPQWLRRWRGRRQGQEEEAATQQDDLHQLPAGGAGEGLQGGPLPGRVRQGAPLPQDGPARGQDTGVVPEQAGQVAEDGEVLGPVHHHGRVRSVRRHGSALAAPAGHHPQVRQGERVRRPLAARHAPQVARGSGAPQGRRQRQGGRTGWRGGQGRRRPRRGAQRDGQEQRADQRQRVAQRCLAHLGDDANLRHTAAALARVAGVVHRRPAAPAAPDAPAPAPQQHEQQCEREQRLGDPHTDAPRRPGVSGERASPDHRGVTVTPPLPGPARPPADTGSQGSGRVSQQQHRLPSRQGPRAQRQAAGDGLGGPHHDVLPAGSPSSAGGAAPRPAWHSPLRRQRQLAVRAPPGAPAPRGSPPPPPLLPPRPPRRTPSPPPPSPRVLAPAHQGGGQSLRA